MACCTLNNQSRPCLKVQPLTYQLRYFGRDRTPAESTIRIRRRSVPNRVNECLERLIMPFELGKNAVRKPRLANYNQ